MAKKETAFVMVRKTWFDLAMNRLVTGTSSHSDMDAHLLIAELDDITDHRGLWLRGIKSDVYQNKIDNSPVVLRLMIPWEFVWTVGLADDAVKIPPGFNTSNTTILTGASMNATT